MKNRAPSRRAAAARLPLGCALLLAPTAACDRAVEKLTEKAIEKAAEKDGQKVDVELDTKTGTMTVEGTDEKGAAVTWQAGEGGLTMQSSGEQGTVQMNVDEGGMRITGPDGTSVFQAGPAATVPASWPQDAVPIYAGTTVVSSMTMPEGAMLMLTSKDAPAEIVAFYTKAFEAWKPQSKMEVPGMVTSSWTDEATKRSVAVQVMRDEEKGESTISLTLNQPKS